MIRARLQVVITITLLATLWVAMSFSGKPTRGVVQLRIEHQVANRKLELDTAWYVNNLGQRFTVTKFKYYIGNIALQKADGSACQLKGYYLVDEEQPESKVITLQQIPEASYTGIQFTLGVDSADNCTGLQSGALDPVNAMFWTWNTGYIFLKLEGKAPQSRSAGTMYEYHIGGYKEPANAIRSVTLQFPRPLVVSATDKHAVVIAADALEVLQKPVTIDFSTLSSVTDAHNATMVADNYKDMFSIKAIE